MPDALPQLDADEQRVLGSLLEKQRTVPGSYPLSLNALRAACSQTSSRDPVVDYHEQDVERVARGLKDRGLLRIVWADTGRRTLKYHQTLTEALGLGDLDQGAVALLTVLLLRGPQPAGELRTRTERLHPFADRDAVEAMLAALAAAERPLVRELGRRPGQKDARWVHLLGPTPDDETAAALPVDPAAGLDLATRDDRVLRSYDAVAAGYADHLTDELRSLPFERWLLERTADLAGPYPVAEVGCGPGHVTAFLAGLGVDAVGHDLSPAMAAEARRRFPEGRYEVGDLRRLMRPDGAEGWGAVLAWYSLVHTAPQELSDVLASLVRPLRPDGWLVYAGHAGEGVLSATEWFEADVELDFVLQEPATVAAAFSAAGLVDVEWYRRAPVTSRDETTERAYVLGRRPAG